MVLNAAAALKNVSLVGQNKTAIIVGGALGIGAAVLATAGTRYLRC